MRATYPVFGACFLMASLAVTASAAAQEGTIQPIAPGVWFREGEMGSGHCNNVIIEMTDHLIVVDANYPSGARALLGEVTKVSPKPIRYVIDTHHHADHAYGNPLFTRAGAVTIGHFGVIEEMKRYEPRFWRGVAGNLTRRVERRLRTSPRLAEELEQIVAQHPYQPPPR
jgi:glyoxylase-like metal-dependent hydrolase (beta-lactamase superfamily II)